MSASLIKRSISFFRPFLPFASKRVRIILRDPDTSDRLVETLRAQRHGEVRTFKIPERIMELIKD